MNIAGQKPDDTQFSYSAFCSLSGTAPNLGQTPYREKLLRSVPNYFVLNTKSVTQPSAVLYLFDGLCVCIGSPHQEYAGGMSGSARACARHTGRLNISFVDGHASALSPTEIFNRVKEHERDYSCDSGKKWQFRIGNVSANQIELVY